MHQRRSTWGRATRRHFLVEYSTQEKPAFPRRDGEEERQVQGGSGEGPIRVWGAQVVGGAEGGGRRGLRGLVGVGVDPCRALGSEKRLHPLVWRVSDPRTMIRRFVFGTREGMPYVS